MKKMYLLLLTLSVTLSACSSIEKESGKSTYTNNPDTAITSEQPEKTEDMQRCTVDNVSFSVDKSWEPMKEHKGTFVTPDKTAVYQLQGISPLGSDTPEEVYEKLKESYMNSYEIVYSDDALQSFVTADKLDAMIGKIEMTEEQVLYSIDVLIVPQKNIVVTFAVQCLESKEPPLDIRNISETAKFHIGTKDFISDNTFVAEDNSELCFRSDNSFIYYQSADDHDGAYYDGTYEVYYGQPAIDKVCSMTEYGITEEELEQTIAANMNGYTLKGDLSNYLDYLGDADDFEDSEEEKSDAGYHVCKDTFYAVILHNGKLVDEDGEVTEMGNDTLYIGHYLPELKLADMVNANTANYIKWTLKGKTE